MINAQQLDLLFLSIFFRIQVILGRDLKTAALITFLYILYYPRLCNEAAAITVFMAKYKAAAFVGKCLYGVFLDYFLHFGFQYDHVTIIFPATAPAVPVSTLAYHLFHIDLHHLHRLWVDRFGGLGIPLLYPLHKQMQLVIAFP